MATVKTGIKTSEFYLALVGAVIPVLNAHLGLNIPVEAVLTIGGIIVAYIISRTVHKTKV